MTRNRRDAALVLNGTLAVLAFLVLAVFMVLTPADAGTTTLTPEPNLPNPAVAKIVSDAEAKGLHCSEDNALTDTIVFEKNDGSVEVVTFDQALAASKAHAGEVVLYCTDAR